MTGIKAEYHKLYFCRKVVSTFYYRYDEVMNNYSPYPSGTDISYFDDVPVRECDAPHDKETVECLNYDCREEFDLTPDGAQMVGTEEGGEYQWWAFGVECPHCFDLGDYGDTD